MSLQFTSPCKGSSCRSGPWSSLYWGLPASGSLFPTRSTDYHTTEQKVSPRQTGEADHLVEGEVPSASESGILQTADASLW